MLYLCRFKPLRDHLRGFLIAAWAGDKIAEFSFPEISFHFPLRPWFFFVSPAYAGKSRECARGLTRARNHPRVCGEKAHHSAPALCRSGSPPRMRGKDDEGRLKLRHVGITPAYAGKRCARRQRSVGAWDHPRVCGEKYPCVCQDLERVGITPAYAGKSSRVLLRCRCTWDHPRVCGEKSLSNSL